MTTNAFSATARSLASGLAAVALAVAFGCTSTQDGGSVTPEVELIDRSTQPLTTGALKWVDGTYGASCAGHTNGEAWSLRIRGTDPMTNPALSVVRNNSTCVLTVTGLYADAAYTATPALALGASYAGSASAFAKVASPVGFYANAKISSTGMASDFTVTIEYSNDLSSVSPVHSVTYATYAGTGSDTNVPPPDYTVTFTGLGLSVSDSNQVQTATGSVALVAGTQAGQRYAVVAGAVDTTYAAVHAAFSAATQVTMAATIPASSFSLTGQILPVTRTVIVENTTDAVPAYEAIAITFNPPCAGTYMCDHFERATLQGAWDQPVNSGGGAMAISTSQAWGGTRSLECELSTVSNAYFCLHETVPRTGNLVVRYSLYLPSDFPRVAVLPAIRHSEGGREVELMVVADAPINQVKFVEQEWTDSPSFYNVLATAPLVKGRWVHVVVVLDRSATPWRGSLFYDGAAVSTSTALARTVTAAATARVELGVIWSDAGTASKLYFDNVAISNP